MVLMWCQYPYSVREACVLCPAAPPARLVGGMHRLP
jgi:hypothetical protein